MEGKEGAVLEREMDKIFPGFLVQITKVGSSVLGFIKLPRWFSCTLKLETIEQKGRYLIN